MLKGEIFKSLKKAVPVLSWIGGNISSNLAFLAISDFLLLYTTESSGSCLLGSAEFEHCSMGEDWLSLPDFYGSFS